MEGLEDPEAPKSTIIPSLVRAGEFADEATITVFARTLNITQRKFKVFTQKRIAYTYEIIITLPEELRL